MAIDDIFQLRTFYTVHGEECLNVYYYRQASGNDVANAADLVTEFLSDVMPSIRALMANTAVLFSQLIAINGNDNGDAKIQSVSLAGTHADANPCTPAIAAALRRSIGLPGKQYAYKRYSGIPINKMSVGGVWQTSITDLLATLAVKLGTTLEGAEGTYSPCQIKGKFKLGVAPVFARLLTGNWQYDQLPSGQDTRQQYIWIQVI